MASERSRKLCFAYDSDTKKCAHGNGITGRGDCVECMAEMLDEAHAAGYRAGIEAAAKAADNHATTGSQHKATLIARAIRALAAKEPGE